MVKSFDQRGAEYRMNLFFSVFKGSLAILENANVWTKVLKRELG